MLEHRVRCATSSMLPKAYTAQPVEDPVKLSTRGNSGGTGTFIKNTITYAVGWSDTRTRIGCASGQLV